MCGIAGIFNKYENKEIRLDTLKKMISVVRHRGPDGFGIYRDERAGLAHARLSIIDLESGWQPIRNEDKTIWIIFNGEIFNYIELRRNLKSRGHRFYTKSDTEVILHLYEDYGPQCLEYLNGQFAFAIWDKNNERLFIARDRVGIRPIYYTHVNGSLYFASEIKSILADNNVTRELDVYALEQIFTYWMTVPPRTSFKNIYELPAGHYMTMEKGICKIIKYWDVDFMPSSTIKSESEYAENLKELLIDSTRLRLRADVPVGAYLSGGIDSSVIASLIKKYTDTPLRTFSVTFSDEVYDESVHQKQMIEHLNTAHSDIKCTYSDIGNVFPDVIWHTEKPIIRTAPAPLYLLSKLVRASNYKVVLTGEGSDEILAGYDIFKETKARKFMSRFPKSTFRPLILKRLYPYLANSPSKSIQYAEEFFKGDSNGYPDEYYSHQPRWQTTSKIKIFFSDDLKNKLKSYNPNDELGQLMSEDLSKYDDLSRSQYLEIKTLLSGYLLSSQGDRVSMANSVEGRYPFLDHRVIEFCAKLPPHVRMNVLTEKYILKESMKRILPNSIIKRSKQPYMAPDSKSFFEGGHLDFLEDILSEKKIRETGYFNEKAVSALVRKCKRSSILGFKDNMAIVGIISTLLTHNLFIEKLDTRISELTNRLTEDKEYAVKV